MWVGYTVMARTCTSTIRVDSDSGEVDKREVKQVEMKALCNKLLYTKHLICDIVRWRLIDIHLIWNVSTATTNSRAVMFHQNCARRN